MISYFKSIKSYLRQLAGVLHQVEVAVRQLSSCRHIYTKVKIISYWFKHIGLSY